MIALKPEFVVDSNEKRRGVLLSLPEWRRVVEELEELEDIREYDAAKARREPSLPFEEAVRAIRKKRKV